MTVAVLFDMDGLLVDSEPVWYAVESAMVTRLGGVWTPADQAACLGGTLHASMRYVQRVTGTDRAVDDLADELLDSMVEALGNGLPVHEGALDLVDAVRASGARTALVTSSYRRIVDAVLPVLGRERFDAVVTGDEVTRGKPDPEPYASAADRLAVPPGSCVVLEDAAIGVRSARAAGCTVVAVPSVGAIEPAPGVHVRPSLRDIDAAWLLGLVARAA